MIKEVIKYTDFDGNAQEEVAYFHLSKTEATMMELSVPGGLSNRLKEVIEANDLGSIAGVMYDMILSAYGQRSADGKRFVKSPEMKEDFKNSIAFDTFFMELAQDENKAKVFIESLNK